MPSEKRLLAGGAALVAVTAAVSVLAYPEMATHWNARGDVDSTMPRALALVLGPALAIAVASFGYSDRLYRRAN